MMCIPNKWIFHFNPKGDMCGKFLFPRLILIFISCQQLLSSVDNCSDVGIIFLALDFHIGSKVGLCAMFQLDWLIWGRARECDAQPDRGTDVQPDAR